ncbi:pyrroline-5-carboxylate reductase [Paraburkholderia kirstenboschensis]|uniref:Pyrroline-5-carboxylate reductase n=1 Tax=Paraburkholderia kirstenboschensis TaxID=1245436 RepID=A0ABZ0EKH0_9BURK|nr:pyrroline-5-carboxylate reductase [Paraburkholderia kirstenboschensis]WOD17090.1 pyrroline-5-carboxylate reductase [Paraburkholderia kirstenboschensis]
MRLGFVGTGAITRAIVTGLTHAKAPFEHIYLSPRNTDVAAGLAELDSRVSVCPTNQDVLDSSDVVCLAVVPQIAVDVFKELRFVARHHVISFLAGVSISDLKQMVGPDSAIIRAIPLPAVAARKGSTAICPPDEIASLLFSHVGTSVEVSDEGKFDALFAVTATMASFYAVMETQAVWLEKQGVDYESGRAYLAAYYDGLSYEATTGKEPFSALVQSSMTTGGINEQLHKELSSTGTYSNYSAALDNVLKRIKGS